MKHERWVDQSTANVGTITGGTATNIVPEWCTFVAEARSQDERRLGELVQEMQDAITFAAGVAECEVETRTRKSYRGYRLTGRTDSAVVLAARALESCGHPITYELSGGAADANVFNDRGFEPFDRRRQGDQAGRVPGRADACRRARADQPRARGRRSRPVPGSAARSPTTPTSASGPGSRRSTRSGRSRAPAQGQGADRAGVRAASGGLTLFTYLHIAADEPLTRGARRVGRHRGRVRDGRDGRGRCRCSRRCPRSPAGSPRRRARISSRSRSAAGGCCSAASRCRAGPGRDHRRRDRRLQRRDHRARARRAGDDPRALDRPDAPPRGDPLRAA